MKKSLLITITLAVSLLLGFTGCANNSDDTTLMMVAINNYNNENVMRDITAEDLAVIKSWNSVKFSCECKQKNLSTNVTTVLTESDSYINVKDDGNVQLYFNYSDEVNNTGLEDLTNTMTYSSFVTSYFTSSSSNTVQINNNRTKIICTYSITYDNITYNNITTFTKQ